MGEIMKYSINTFVYEAANIPLQKALLSISKFGFKFVDLAACGSGDPTLMNKTEMKKIIQMFNDLGIKSSQMLLLNTIGIASFDTSQKSNIIDYMKRCSEFQLELGGKQVLICWGGGVYETEIMKEKSWINSVLMIKEFSEWALNKGIIVELEMDPHVYFIINNMEKMAKILEDIDMPNVFPNIDIGHLCITREAPQVLQKFKNRILHVHISETNTFEHTNNIIGQGKADFKSYISKLIELGIEDTCKKYEETAIAGIEMGEQGKVDNPERWISESLNYLQKVLPEVTI